LASSTGDLGTRLGISLTSQLTSRARGEGVVEGRGGRRWKRRRGRRWRGRRRRRKTRGKLTPSWKWYILIKICFV